MTNWGRVLLACLLLLAAASAAWPNGDFGQERAIMDSLSRVHPRMRADWLAERGIRDEYWQGCVVPQDSGIRCIGRWSYGPSYDVDGRVTPSETLVALARGSGVSLLRFSRQDSLTIELLSDVNAGGIMKRVAVRDSLLYVGSTAGLEIWNITDERNPQQRSWIHTALNDFALQDSFAYVIGPDDSFKVYNVGNPASPVFRGACRDSGYCVSVTDSLALVADRWGLYVLGVGNPAQPHRLNSWGSAVDAVTTRGSLACVTQFNPSQPGELSLRTLDVSAPQSIRQLGSLSGAGGLDVHLQDTLLFCSGDANDHNLKIVSIADSTHPRLVGTASSPGWGMGVWASAVNKNAFYAAHFEGTEVYDIANTSSPVKDTSLAPADMSLDIDVHAGLAIVANGLAGFSVLDVSEPRSPKRIGVHDTLGQRPNTESAVLGDSFAFVGWTPVPYFRSFDVRDPTRPAYAGGVDVANFPDDMVLRDSFVYVAEMNFLQIVNIAQPSEPVLVGSCVAGDATNAGLWLDDTLAYVANYVSRIVNVRNPAAPQVIGQFSRGAWDVQTADTIAFLTTGSLVWYDVANPASPQAIDSIGLGFTAQGLAIVDTIAYTGSLYDLCAVSVADLHRPRVLSRTGLPYSAKRIMHIAPYLYVVCWDAGVCIFETVSVGIDEDTVWKNPPAGDLAIRPNPTTGLCAVVGCGDASQSVEVRDVAGRTILAQRCEVSKKGRFVLNLTGLKPGVYFVEVGEEGKRTSAKLVKQ